MQEYMVMILSEIDVVNLDQIVFSKKTMLQFIRRLKVNSQDESIIGCLGANLVEALLQPLFNEKENVNPCVQIPICLSLMDSLWQPIMFGKFSQEVKLVLACWLIENQK